MGKNEDQYIRHSSILVYYESEVLKHLKELDASKAMGPDNINPFLIKSMAEVFVKPLTLIFKKSVSSSIVPSGFPAFLVFPSFPTFS